MTNDAFPLYKPAVKSKRLTIAMTPDEYLDLQISAEENQIGQAELLRQIIKTYIAARREAQAKHKGTSES